MWFRAMGTRLCPIHAGGHEMPALRARGEQENAPPCGGAWMANQPRAAGSGVALIRTRRRRSGTVRRLAVRGRRTRRTGSRRLGCRGPVGLRCRRWRCRGRWRCRPWRGRCLGLRRRGRFLHGGRLGAGRGRAFAIRRGWARGGRHRGRGRRRGRGGFRNRCRGGRRSRRTLYRRSFGRWRRLDRRGLAGRSRGRRRWLCRAGGGCIRTRCRDGWRCRSRLGWGRRRFGRVLGRRLLGCRVLGRRGRRRRRRRFRHGGRCGRTGCRGCGRGLRLRRGPVGLAR